MPEKTRNNGQNYSISTNCMINDCYKYYFKIFPACYNLTGIKKSSLDIVTALTGRTETPAHLIRWF